MSNAVVNDNDVDQEALLPMLEGAAKVTESEHESSEELFSRIKYERLIQQLAEVSITHAPVSNNSTLLVSVHYERCGYPCTYCSRMNGTLCGYGDCSQCHKNCHFGT